MRIPGLLRRVNTVGLTRAHANPSMILRNQNRIGLNALANLPGKEHFMQFVFSGLLLSRHRKLCRILIHTVYLLSKHTAINRTEFNSRRSIYPTGL